MIVLDEQISNNELRYVIAHWYPGAMLFLTELRPRTKIPDADVAKLLLMLKAPTFITTNYTDFGHKQAAHAAFCVICLKLPIERWREVAVITRQILGRKEFATKRKRLGKIISWSDGKIDYYE